MNLKRLANEVLSLVNEELILTADGTEPLDEYELEFDRTVDLTQLDKVMDRFRGIDLTASDDAAMAIGLHAALQLTAREAADRNLWWWLCLRRHPDIVQRRWIQLGTTSSLSLERMLGQVNRNAFARLWWGAEMVQALPNPESYTRLMFKNQDLFEAVIGRSLGRYPEALQIVLDELASTPGKRAREVVRDLRFLLSTLVLEALDVKSLQKEVGQLKAAHA